MHVCGVTILRALLFLSNQADSDTRRGVLHAFYRVTVFTQNAKAHHLRNKSPLRSERVSCEDYQLLLPIVCFGRDETEMDKDAGKGSCASISSPSTSSAAIDAASTANARTLSTQDQNNSNNNDGFKRTLSIFDMVIYGLIFMVPIAPFSCLWRGSRRLRTAWRRWRILSPSLQCSSRCSHSAS